MHCRERFVRCVCAGHCPLLFAQWDALGVDNVSSLQDVYEDKFASYCLAPIIVNVFVYIDDDKLVDDATVMRW